MTDAERIAALESRVSELEAVVAKWAHAVGYMDSRLSKHLPPAPLRLWDFSGG